MFRPLGHHHVMYIHCYLDCSFLNLALLYFRHSFELRNFHHGEVEDSQSHKNTIEEIPPPEHKIKREQNCGIKTKNNLTTLTQKT
jgi:hypothetical protein